MPDKIFLQGLETRCRIGIFDWERKIRQKIVMDFEFPCDTRRAGKSDRIEDTVDYKKISKHVLSFVSKSDYQLIEALAENLADSVLTTFGLRELTLRLSKPGAIRGAENVGVTITRKMEPANMRAFPDLFSAESGEAVVTRLRQGSGGSVQRLLGRKNPGLRRRRRK